MQTELTPTIAEMSEVQKKTMQTKIFSVKDGSISTGSYKGEPMMQLYDDNDVVACTSMQYCTEYNCKFIPMHTLIRKQKTDEELAEDFKGKVIDLNNKAQLGFTDEYFIGCRTGYFEGRKSVGGDYHLSINEMMQFAFKIYHKGVNGEKITSLKDEVTSFLSSLTPPIYPTTITVKHDGEKYYWETLKWEY